MVNANNGDVSVRLKVPEDQSEAIAQRVKVQLDSIDGIMQPSVLIDPYY